MRSSSPVSPTSRRIFLYWLLLLIPALVVGLGAIQLLKREEARIVAQSAYADDARRAAALARARLIVENTELLVGDVQSGLLDVLALVPDDDLTSYFDNFEKSNPLVRIGFKATPDGRLLRPTADAATDEQRGFVRRFAPVLRAQPLWSVTQSKDRLERAAPALTDADARARQDITSNVAQVQSARRDVQQLLRSENYPASAPSSLSSSSQSKAMPAQRARNPSSFSAEVKKETDAATSDRRGWSAIPIDGHLHLLGWVIPANSTHVRGVEVQLATLVERLGSAMPERVGVGEGYVLRDERGRVLHQVGAVPRSGEPVARVPIAAALLPGWDVAAYLEPGAVGSAGSTAIFWTGTLLIGIFIAAIVAGGSLLLWQARRSAAEAAQKTSFVANVSHEFKTPLTTIRLYAELLEQRRVKDAVKSDEYLRTIGRETQRLARLVNNVLDFSRLEQGRKKFARETIDLKAEVLRLLDAQAPRLAEAGLRLERALPEDAVPLATDRDALEQIVLNLLDNACKYAGSGGEVRVALEPKATGGAILKVADRGPGVPHGHREKIFEKFHRVDDALTAEKSGAGLGLSIARQLARGLGGDLRYAPRQSGGAEFILELPG